MPKNLSPRAMFDLTNHYSKLQEQEERDEAHRDTALRRFVSAFRPGSNEGPAGEALARAYEQAERAFHEDVDPDTGEHSPRSITRRTADMDPEGISENSGMPIGHETFTLDGVGARLDDRGFPLHVWHPGEGCFTPATWDDQGNLVDPDLSHWLEPADPES